MSILFRLSSTTVLAIAPVLAFAADLGLPRSYECGTHSVAIAAGVDEARVRVGGTWRTLVPAVAASGARYEAADDPEVWVWGKGEDFMVKLPETGETACTALPAAAGFSAGGNEPGWRLTIEGETATLTTMDGGEMALAATGAEPVAGGRRILMGEAGAEVLDSVCRDNATGMPHPHSVTLSMAGSEMSGCGGAPADLLTGIDWTILAAGGTPVGEGIEANIRFHPDGSFSGTGGCNRMHGTYTLSGEGLAIGPAAMTMMMCGDDQMKAEQAVGAALATITRFDFAEDGSLQLIAADQTAIEARP
jgi:heat shock protein HslJ